VHVTPAHRFVGAQGLLIIEDDASWFHVHGIDGREEILESRLLLTMLKSKIHRARVTGADLNYVGSISIDPVLMAASGILEHELVHVLNVSTGARFETYAIAGGPGEICLNGAAARLAELGDIVIVIAYAIMEEAEARSHAPTVVLVDEHNRVIGSP